MSERENQLEWTAFCYVSGDLSPTEAEQFEVRLADDQESREALARAVELTQVVAAAESSCGDLVASAALKPATWSTRLSWMAIGGLASLVIAMVWSGGMAQFGRGRGNSSENDALASAWSATRIELGETSEVGPLHPLTSNSEGDDDQPAVGALTDELVVADAPSWMTVAVEGLASEMMDQDESGSDEPVVN